MEFGRYSQAGPLSGGSGEASVSRLIQIAVRTQFLVTGALKSLYSFWLSTENYSLFLKATYFPSYMIFFIFKASEHP